MAQTPDDESEICLSANLERLACLLNTLLGFVAKAAHLVPGAALATLRKTGLRLLRPAEAMARRLLILAATPTEPSARSKPGQSVRAQPKPKNAVFQLAESMPPLGWAEVPDAVDAPSDAAQLSNGAPVSAARFLARVQALTDLVEHFDRHTLRMGRYLARQARAETLRASLGPLMPLRLWGASGLDPLFRSGLWQADRLAFRRLYPPDRVPA